MAFSNLEMALLEDGFARAARESVERSNRELLPRLRYRVAQAERELAAAVQALSDARAQLAIAEANQSLKGRKHGEPFAKLKELIS